MTSILPYITARVISAQDPRPYSGKGVVEKADGEGKFVIALSSGKMTVQCTSGSLSEGDTVFVRVQGKDLIIQRAPGPTPPPAIPPIQDALDLRQLRDAGATKPAFAGGPKAAPALAGPGTVSSGFSFPLEGPRVPAEGFYYFDTVEKALSWLATVSPGSDTKNQRTALQDFARDPVVLQVVKSGEGNVRALFLPLQAADVRLSYFVNERLHSGLWNDFFPEGLMPLLLERRTLSSERLIAIDALLPEKSGAKQLFPVSGDGLSAGTSPVAATTGGNRLFVQWLNIAMDETAPMHVLSNLLPIPSTTELPPLVEEIRQARQAGPGAATPPPGTQDFSIDQSSFEGRITKAAIVPRVLEGLGINHENALYNLQDAGDAPEGILPNLKHFLLALERDLDNAISRQNSGKPGNSPEALHSAVRAFSDAWETSSKQLMRELFPRVGDQSIADNGTMNAEVVAGRIFGRFQEWSQRIHTLMENVLSEVEEPAGKVQRAAENVNVVREGPTQASSPPAGDRSAVVAKEAVGIDTLMQSVSLRIKTAFGDIAGKIEGFLQSFSSRYAGLLKDQPVSLPRVRAQVDAAMREIAVFALRQMRPISGLLDNANAQSSRLIDHFNRASGVHEGNPSLEATRRLAETALQRIDSMQVSARQVATGDVRQQVVMVPMNIDGQWNDVIVKFVRDNGRAGKKKARKNIAVAINVAPAFLGEINVSMNYAGTDLSVRMDFDKDRTLSWFEANRQGVVDAFVKLGFKGPTINMQKSVKRRSPALTGALPSSTAAIDIVI